MGTLFPQDFIEAVRNSGDIVRLVSDYVPLKAAGAKFKGLCPFHQEKTPSFTIDPTLQLFYCFGCQTGGDLFKFFMLYEKVGFTEAVEALARRWGVPQPAHGHGRSTGDGLARLLELNRTAQAYFQSRLHDPEGGAPARAYLAKRSISDETAARLGLGYAPDSWESLRSHLIGARYQPEELLRAGLVLARKSGGEYDRFRDRLTFPIRDLSGRTVAFGGRAIGDAEPKYINSPETPAYKKGEHLYGLDLAREAIRREGFALVVEGYLDLAAVLQGGFDNVVASLGTAFTPAQARLLARYSTRAFFSYDGDGAGAAATERSLGLLLDQGFEVRVVELPKGMDPDDFIRAEGAEDYGRLQREAPGYLDFLVRREARSRDLRQIEQKVAAVNAVMPHLIRLASPIQRAAWASRLADALGIEDQLVLQELRTALRSAQPRIRQRPGTPRLPREAERRLVARLLHSDEERRRWAAELDPAELEGSEVAPIVQVIVRLTLAGATVSYPAVLDALGDDAERAVLTRIAFHEEPEDGPSVEDCLWAFRRARLAREERQVVREIGELQQAPGAASSPPDVDQKLLRLQQLARQRDAIS